MDYYNNVSGAKRIMEPPPDLPLHSFGVPITSRELHGRRFVSRLRELFSVRRGGELGSIPDHFVSDIDGNKGNTNANSSYNTNNVNHSRYTIIDKPRIHLKDEDPSGQLQENNHVMMEDSAKTFLTGNNMYASHIPRFPSKERVESSGLDFLPPPSVQKQGADPHSKTSIKKPLSSVLGDSSLMRNMSTTPASSKNLSLHKLSKRLNSIANKKQETSRLFQKFCKDLEAWGQKTSADNEESLNFVKELHELFQQDLLLEQRISEKLKLLTKELEFIGMREAELSFEKKNLLAAFRKYENSKEKRGEFNEETNLFRERAMAHEKSFEIHRSHYQYAVSVSARQLFNEVAIEYYEKASDLKEGSGNFLKKALQILETANGGEAFLRDLEKLRLIRAERNWAKLRPQRKSDPQSWINMVSGKHDFDDTLMKKVYEGLPAAYTPIPRGSPVRLPKLDLQTGLDESFSGGSSNRFNPITSNEFFMGRSPVKTEGNSSESREESLNQQKKDENIDYEPTRSLNPRVLLNQSDEEAVKILSLRNPSNNILKPVDSMEKKTKNPLRGAKVEKDQNNGFILNFGEISQQFYDAERNLQENRWTEPSAYKNRSD